MTDTTTHGVNHTDVKVLKEKIDRLEEHRLDKIEETLEEVVRNQRRMERELERYSARWGFVLMVGTGLIAALKLGWQDILRIFGK